MKRNRVWDAPRCQVLVEYAKWTARAAVNSGGPIKDTNTIYRLLDGVAFADVLSGETEISAEEFNRWHRRETEGLCCRANDLRPQVAPFPVGWSAKLINVFLKTTVYVGNLGRAGLRNVQHPPLDNGLQAGLLERFPELDGVNFGRISPWPPVVLGGLLDAMTGTPCADRDGRHPGLGHACARHRDGVP